MTIQTRITVIVFVALFQSALGTGCSSTVELSRKQRARIHTVSVESVELKDDTIQYMGPIIEGYDPVSPMFMALPLLRELAILYCVTPIGMWQVSVAYDQMEEALTRRVVASGVDVEDVVRQRFVQKLRQAKMFTVVSSSDADATVKIDFETGLTPSNGWFGYGVQPWIVVNAVMTVGDQRVVWRKEAEVSSFAKQLPSREANLYFRKPELFEESLRIAVRLAINELVTHLRQS
jgi:hypothetical protein